MRFSIKGMSPSFASGYKGYCFWWGKLLGFLRVIYTGWAEMALPYLSSGCPDFRLISTSVRDKHTFSVDSFSIWIYAYILDRLSLPRIRVGLSGITRKAGEKKNGIPVTTQLLCKEFYNPLSRNARYIVADLVEREPRLERMAEKVAPVSSRKLTGWPPTIRVTWGSCGVMRIGAKVESPGPYQSWSWVWDSDPWNLHPWGQWLFQWSPLQVGQVLCGGLWLPWGHCPFKCSSLPQRKQAPGFSIVLLTLEP